MQRFRTWISYLRRVSRITMLFLAILVLSEWHAEHFQQLRCLLIVLCRCYDRDFHAADLVDLVVLNLRENQLLAQAKGIVAATIESVARNSPEITHPRQHDV